MLERARSSTGTYVLVRFGGFGWACIWDLRHAHTPCPPSLLQLSKELLLGGVYPDTGGMSGNSTIKLPMMTLENGKGDLAVEGFRENVLKFCTFDAKRAVIDRTLLQVTIKGSYLSTSRETFISLENNLNVVWCKTTHH